MAVVGELRFGSLWENLRWRNGVEEQVCQATIRSAQYARQVISVIQNFCLIVRKWYQLLQFHTNTFVRMEYNSLILRKLSHENTCLLRLLRNRFVSHNVFIDKDLQNHQKTAYFGLSIRRLRVRVPSGYWLSNAGLVTSSFWGHGSVAAKLGFWNDRLL